MPTPATYDDANLILRLYEMRREEKLRQARQWFVANVFPNTVEEMQQLAPPGSQENTYIRMVLSYWDMAASFVTSGVLNQELFFQSSGELLLVWDRVKGIVAGFRGISKNPQSWHNLETVGNAYIQWLQAKGPEAYEGFRALTRSGRTAARAT